MKKNVRNPLYAALLSAGLLAANPLPAEPAAKTAPATQAQAEAQSPAAQSVQGEVDKNSQERVDAKRKEILRDAVKAVVETENALRALDAGKKEDALKALEKATGKLELVLARDPSLALALVDVSETTFDLLADTKTIKSMIYDAEKALRDGRIQVARGILLNLASEIVLRTTSIPLGTYPDAIKAVTPLIDAGKIDEAKAALVAALNTLVTEVEVIPLPVLRAGYLLTHAEKLAEKAKRDDKENKMLDALLKEARNQIQMAELLGYGDKDAFQPMYEQLDQIEEKAKNGNSGSGWFTKIKKELSELF